jgi:hypothetical protein
MRLAAWFGLALWNLDEIMITSRPIVIFSAVLVYGRGNGRLSRMGLLFPDRTEVYLRGVCKKIDVRLRELTHWSILPFLIASHSNARSPGSEQEDLHQLPPQSPGVSRSSWGSRSVPLGPEPRAVEYPSHLLCTWV